MMENGSTKIGFNSDVIIKGESYHIQSEDWGASQAYLVSQIFKSGAIIKTIKIPYSEILPGSLWEEPVLVEQALKSQHSDILKKLISGSL